MSQKKRVETADGLIRGMSEDRKRKKRFKRNMLKQSFQFLRHENDSRFRLRAEQDDLYRSVTATALIKNSWNLLINNFIN